MDRNTYSYNKTELSYSVLNKTLEGKLIWRRAFHLLGGYVAKVDKYKFHLWRGRKIYCDLSVNGLTLVLDAEVSKQLWGFITKKDIPSLEGVIKRAHAQVDSL